MPSPETDWLCLRPLSGAEADIQYLRPELERDPVRPARFGLPDSKVLATQDAARILADALRLSLRRGAGPFRSAARLGFEPRAYQLLPLLMALRLPTVRLMIADDVGIGKTIEAGLIIRELLDRGEVDRIAVLCPPHWSNNGPPNSKRSLTLTQWLSPPPRRPAWNGDYPRRRRSSTRIHLQL